jgi:hypothetical protein
MPLTQGTYYAWPPTSSSDVQEMERNAKRQDMLRGREKLPPQLPEDLPGFLRRLKAAMGRLFRR